MNSIDKDQNEKNFENLIGKEGVAKIKEFVKKSGTCFFCTAMAQNRAFETRPMELEEIPKAQLLFQGSPYSNYLSLFGSVKISQDKNKIHELWEPTMKTWFTEGIDDARITVLQFIPSEGYYWDTKNGVAVATIKRLFGAVVGETHDDSIQGNIIV